MVTFEVLLHYMYRFNIPLKSYIMVKKLFFPLLALLFVIGCNQTGTNPKIKTSYYIHRSRIIEPAAKLDTVFINGGLTFTNHYGPDGKKDTIFSSDGSVTTFSGDDKISLATNVDRAGKIIGTHKEFLNENGSTDSSVDMENGKLKWTRKFVYDNAGNNIEQRAYEMNAVDVLKLNFTIKYK